MKIRTIAFASLIAVSSVSSAVPARAMAPKAAITCDLKGPLGELAQIKAGASASTSKELSVRKDLLKASMDCNAREARALAASVSELDETSRAASSLQKRYGAELATAASFVASRTERIDSLETVEDSKALARELKEWRDTAYNPLAWQASQLIFMSKNVLLASSGEKRARQLKARISLLPDSTENKALDERTHEARALIAEAQDDLAGAISYLKDGGVTQQERVAAKQKEALDALGRAYGLLLQVSDAIPVSDLAL